MATRAGKELRRINWDTWSGMFYSDITAYFIILATAVTLHVAGDHRHQHRGAGGQRAASRWPAISPFCFSPWAFSASA